MKHAVVPSLFASAALLALALPALAAPDQARPGQGSAIVTLLPAKGHEAVANVQAEDLKLKVGGKPATVEDWVPLRGDRHKLEVVVLIDDGANSRLSIQLPSIEKFLKSLPEGALAAVGYMRNGQAVLASPLTADHAAAAKGLRLPVASSPGISASPYFCLSDLAKKWPSQDQDARREVVFITNGINYYSDEFDPQNPYYLSSISDALRNKLVVFPIYWPARGGFDLHPLAANNGQSLLAELASATGGVSYWQGVGEPVSIDSYLDEIAQRIESQYALFYRTDAKVSTGVQNLKLQVERSMNKVTAPSESWVK